MGYTGLDPTKVDQLAGAFGRQAEESESIATDIRRALLLADLSDPIGGRFEDRADQFRSVASELESRVREAQQFGVNEQHLSAGLASVNLVAELNWQIDNWAGTDNDPRFDDLVRERNRLTLEQFGPNADPVTAAVAEYYQVSYVEAEFALLLDEVNGLNEAVNGWSGHPNDPALTTLSTRRAVLAEQLLAGDDKLARAVLRHMGTGQHFLDAIAPATSDVYGDSSIAALQEAFLAHGHGYGLALAPLADLHRIAVEDFTGVSAELVNPAVAAFAQDNDMAYNAIVDAHNGAIDESAEGLDSERLVRIALNDTIPNEATALYNLSQRELFTELETAKQANQRRYDGKLSTDDLSAVLANPQDFSVEAVALASFLIDNEQLRVNIDTAQSHQFLDSLETGQMVSFGGDGTISFADVEQHITNSLIFGLLAPVAGTIDSNSDGDHSRDEFEAHLDQLDPEGQLTAAIDYALSDDAFSDRDRRGGWEKFGDGLWEVTSLVPGSPSFVWELATDPTGLASNYGSFAKGLLWEFPKGLAVLAYDASSLVPGSPAFLVEGWRTTQGGEHRGVALLTGAAHMVDAGMTLNPASPQFFEEVQRLRRSGRWSDHQGLGVAATLIDWEGFLDNPSQWFGTITGDILLDLATAGGGSAATGARRVGTAARHAGQASLTKLDNILADLRRIRMNAGNRLTFELDMMSDFISQGINGGLGLNPGLVTPGLVTPGGRIARPGLLDNVGNRVENANLHMDRGTLNPRDNIPGGSLLDHEASPHNGTGTGNGHTLRLHAGRTRKQLERRLDDIWTRWRSGSKPTEFTRDVSTFDNRFQAENLIGRALDVNQAKVDRWLANPLARKRLVLVMDVAEPIGTVLQGRVRNGRLVVNDLGGGDRIRVVIVRSTNPNRRFEVLTAYPERKL